MFIIKVTNTISGKIQESKFSSESECSAWIEECESNESWGKLGRTISHPEQSVVIPEYTLRTPATYDENGAELTPESSEVIPESTELIEAHDEIIAKEYSLEIIDKTSEFAQAETNREALEYLAETDWLAIRSLDGIPVPEDIQALRIAARNRIVR